MKFKNAASAFGNGLLTASTAIANAPVRMRITEIDAEIEKLQKEKTELEKKLIK